MSREFENWTDPIKIEEINKMLKVKEDEYFKARAENRHDDADRIEKEYNNLLTEIRFNHPGIDLTDQEKIFKRLAEEKTFQENIRPKRK